MYSNTFWYFEINSDIFHTFRYFLIHSDTFIYHIYSDVFWYTPIYSDTFWYFMLYFGIFWYILTSVISLIIVISVICVISVIFVIPVIPVSLSFLSSLSYQSKVVRQLKKVTNRWRWLGHFSQMQDHSKFWITLINVYYIFNMSLLVVELETWTINWSSGFYSPMWDHHTSSKII